MDSAISNIENIMVFYQNQFRPKKKFVKKKKKYINQSFLMGIVQSVQPESNWFQYHQIQVITSCSHINVKTSLFVFFPSLSPANHIADGFFFHPQSKRTSLSTLAHLRKTEANRKCGKKKIKRKRKRNRFG